MRLLQLCNIRAGTFSLLHHLGQCGSLRSMTTQLDLTLGEVLLVWRTRAGFTLAGMGEALEVGRNTVARWEAGQGRMRWRDVEAWAEACNQDNVNLVRPLWEQAVDARPRMGRPPRVTQWSHRPWVLGVQVRG